MKTQNNLSKTDEILIYLNYEWYYNLNTGKKLSNTTIEEALKEFTFDDMFMEYVNQVSRNWSEKESIYWDDNMEKFDVQNYLVPDEKLINNKAWIKVRTENGYEVHYASRSMRKRRWNELLVDLLNKSSLITKQITKRLSNGILDNEKLDAKLKEIDTQIIELKIRESIKVKPYEVKIRRTKTKFEYLLPYQYEVIDVEETVESFLGGIKQITIKSFFNSDNEDKIFYLRTRGIPHKMAIVLSSLKDCYFKVDIVGMINEYNEQLKNSIQFIE